MSLNEKDLVDKVRELGPWHFKFPLPNGKITTDYNKNKISEVNPFQLKGLFKRIYPNGLAGKSFLDIGCNSGGYCFLANQLGSTNTFGFDVRDHWINQAKFIRDHIYETNKDHVKFDVMHMHDLDKTKYDLVLFKGVLYHLPNPFSALEQVAAVTKEYLIIDTAGSRDIPEDCMQIYFEKDGLMAGNDSISWLPGSGKLIGHYLDYLGFAEWKVIMEKPYPDRRVKRGISNVPPLKRIRILAKK